MSMNSPHWWADVDVCTLAVTQPINDVNTLFCLGPINILIKAYFLQTACRTWISLNLFLFTWVAMNLATDMLSLSFFVPALAFNTASLFCKRSRRARYSVQEIPFISSSCRCVLPINHFIKRRKDRNTQRLSFLFKASIRSRASRCIWITDPAPLHLHLQPRVWQAASSEYENSSILL